MVRLALEQREGIYVRNNMVSFLWEDMHKKAKKLGVSDKLKQILTKPYVYPLIVLKITIYSHEITHSF